MSIKVELLSWAVKTFGENDPYDIINVREEIFLTKDPKLLQQKIILFVKKRIGVDAKWATEALSKQWKEELQKMVGEYLKFDLRASEGRELQSLSGIEQTQDGEGKYTDKPITNIYNYQFNLEVVKYVSTKEKSHVSPKPVVEKK